MNNIRAGLPLDIHDHRGNLVHPRGLLHVFSAVNDGGHIGEHHRGAVSIGDDDRAVILAGEKLIVGVDLVILMRPVEVSFGLIDAGLLDAVRTSSRLMP